MKMTKLIYAIKISDISYSGLKILDIKIGKTTNIQSTISQYERGNRDIEVLDLWKPNNDLTYSKCKIGVHKVAERYAYERESEKFVFLHDRYDKFSKAISELLKNMNLSDLESNEKESKEQLKEENNFTGEKPKLLIFENKNFNVSTWREILQNLCKQINEDSSDFEKVEKIKGRKRTYFTKTPSKNSLKQPIKITGTNYYFEGNISANRTMKIIKQLLEKFDYKKSNLQIYGKNGKIY